MLRELGTALLELLYPSDIYCIRCGEPIHPGNPLSLCESCEAKLNRVGESVCLCCGKPMDIFSASNPKMLAPRLCGDCRSGGRVIKKGFTCLLYDGPERAMIHRFKFENKPWYGPKLAVLLEERLALENLGDYVIVPVPMHKKRRKERGYNQAYILAKALARRVGKPFLGNCLVRSRSTVPMKDLAGAERLANVTKAFAVTGPERCRLAGQTVVLVDDIYTTGSTGDACANVLLEAGAAQIFMLTLASGYGSLK